MMDSPRFLSSLYVEGSIHCTNATIGGQDCYIVAFLNPWLNGAVAPSLPPAVAGVDTYAIAIDTVNAVFFVDALANFTVLNTP